MSCIFVYGVDDGCVFGVDDVVRSCVGVYFGVYFGVYGVDDVVY